jgi:hypothetical protein
VPSVAVVTAFDVTVGTNRLPRHLDGLRAQSVEIAPGGGVEVGLDRLLLELGAPDTEPFHHPQKQPRMGGRRNNSGWGADFERPPVCSS